LGGGGAPAGLGPVVSGGALAVGSCRAGARDVEEAVRLPCIEDRTAAHDADAGVVRLDVDT
jgi:hypothetical protein